jgi:hypothetical protein
LSSVLPPAGESGTSREEAFRPELKEHPLYKAGVIASFISPSWGFTGLAAVVWQRW